MLTYSLVYIKAKQTHLRKKAQKRKKTKTQHIFHIPIL